jgi:PAS domain S-box-containing protein
MDQRPQERLARLLTRLRDLAYLAGASVLVIIWFMEPSLKVGLLVVGAFLGVCLNIFWLRGADPVWRLAYDVLGTGIVWWFFGSTPAVYLILATITVIAPILLSRRKAIALLGEIFLTTVVIATASVLSSNQALPYFHQTGLTWVDRFVDFGLPLVVILFVGILVLSIAGHVNRDLAANEKRLRLSLDNAATGMIFFGLDGMITQANQAFCEEVGYTQDQLLMMTWRDLIKIDDQAAAQHRLDEALTDGPTHWRAEDRIVRTDGSEFWAGVVVTLIHDENGTPNSYFAQITDISDQKAAEQALSSSERRYRGLFEGIPVALYRTSPDGRILDANQALVDLLGFPDRETMLQMDVHDAYVDASDRNELATRLEAEGQVLGIEEQLRTNDGRTIWVRDSSRIVRDEGGGIAFYEGALVDTTFRHEAESALRESEARFRAIFEHAPIGVIAVNTNDAIVAANSELARMVGRPIDQLRGTDISDLTHPDDRAVDSDMRDELISGDVPSYRLTKRYLHADGHVIWIELAVTLVRDENDEPELLIGLIRDITEQRRAQTDRDHMIRILEATSDLVAILDFRGQVTYANKAARDWYGPDADTQTLDITKMIDGTRGPGVGEIFEELLESDVWRGEINLRSHSGETIPGSAVVVAHRDSSGMITHFSATFRDLVEREETQQRLEHLIRSKDEFVASVSHELRTPLTAVVGLAQELRKSWEMFATDEISEFIGLIADQATEVADIVEDLLVAARADIGKVTVRPEAVDVKDQIDGVIAALGSQDRTRITVDISSTDVWADPTRLRQIIRNLLTNAIRYGGRDVWLATSVIDGQMKLRIADDGPGISPGLEEKIFEPYTRAHEPGSQPNSVGLGLTVSRHLARLMGGDLAYEREPMSAFVLTLPTAEAIAGAGVA